MVPYGLNQEQFVAMYQQHLDRASKEAIATIRGFLSLPLGPGIDNAHVEIFLDEYGSAPSTWIYHRGKNNKVDGTDPSIFPGKSTELALGLESLNEIDEQYFIQPEDFPGLHLAAPLLSKWFAECWWKAGGWSYPVPTRLAVHDYGTYGYATLSEGST